MKHFIPKFTYNYAKIREKKLQKYSKNKKGTKRCKNTQSDKTQCVLVSDSVGIVESPGRPVISDASLHVELLPAVQHIVIPQADIPGAMEVDEVSEDSDAIVSYDENEDDSDMEEDEEDNVSLDEDDDQ